MAARNAVLSATLGLLAALALIACRRGAPPDAHRAPIRVAAAADLTLAFEELGRDFERRTGRPVVFSFGSTGLLAKQLREGAPFDVFAAANVSFVDEVVAAGACDGATRAPYARGRIAVWTKRGGVAPPATVGDLGDARFRRIAIANPEHAPYGQAAKQALERVALWDAVAPRLVLGDNVRQAFQFAETGNAETALVALALVVNDRENPWFAVDEAMHRPIEQALAVCTRGENREGGDAFARFVNSEDGRAVMRRYGFLLPGETLVRAP
ncbi:MAG: molybdate ABC transporter substrate-binding protein [Deltaproteobacteria bacterium]|nr:molybdate ABC transporter substrate-binding protein [Deltaproteobacteria bacterium]